MNAVVRLEFDRIDSEIGESLVRAVLAEYVDRYGGIDADRPAPDEFTAPEGAFLIAYVDGSPIGCGGLRQHSPGVGEIKRMYVEPGSRKLGIGRAILRALERRARELGYPTLRLETGCAPARGDLALRVGGLSPN